MPEIMGAYCQHIFNYDLLKPKFLRVDIEIYIKLANFGTSHYRNPLLLTTIKSQVTLVKLVSINLLIKKFMVNF